MTPYEQSIQAMKNRIESKYHVINKSNEDQYYRGQLITKDQPIKSDKKSNQSNLIWNGNCFE